MDLTELKELYEKKSTYAIVEALRNPDDFEPDALAVMKEVLTERGFSPDEVTTRPPPPPELDWSSSQLSKKRAKAAVFDEHPDLTPDQIRQRPVTHRIGRWIVAVLVADAALFLAASFDYSVPVLNAFAGLFTFSMAILFISRKVMSRYDPLDRLRWKRFVIGDAIGYMTAYFFLIDFWPHNTLLFGDETRFWTSFVLIFLGACLAGLVGGSVAILVMDKRDKESVVELYQLWKDSRAYATSKPNILGAVAESVADSTSPEE